MQRDQESRYDSEQEMFGAHPCMHANSTSHTQCRTVLTLHSVLSSTLDPDTSFPSWSSRDRQVPQPHDGLLAQQTHVTA